MVLNKIRIMYIKHTALTVINIFISFTQRQYYYSIITVEYKKCFHSRDLNIA